MSAGQVRRLAAAEERTPGKAKPSGPRSELDRKWGAKLRPYVAALDCPEWPVWPEAVDAGFHAWVRAHWTVKASDEFDLCLAQDLDLLSVERKELCGRLIEQREDPAAVRVTLAEHGCPLWPAEYERPWYEWYMKWPPVPLAGLSASATEFVLDFHDLIHSWSYCTPESFEEYKRRPRREHEAKWARPHDELLAELRERRMWGIRGCYRLIGSMWEYEQGLTAADVDAP